MMTAHALDRPRSRKQLRAEDDVQDPLDLAEAIRIEGERDFDRAIFRPVDLKQKPLWGELDQVQPEVPGISVGLMRLDIADAPILLELALNEEIRPLGRLQVKVSVRVLGIEGNLEDQSRSQRPTRKRRGNSSVA